MSYDGQRMKGIIMKRAERKETFEAFVCCGNLNENTTNRCNASKSVVAGISAKPSNKYFLLSRADK